MTSLFMAGAHGGGGGVDPEPSGPMSYRQMIAEAGASAGLQLCLDAADAASYAAGSQYWRDTSGNGVDFLRGATAAANATDPTFNGVVGGLTSNEYFSFDGGDLFSSAQASDVLDGLLVKESSHTLAAVIYIPSGSARMVSFLGRADGKGGGPYLYGSSQSSYPGTLLLKNNYGPVNIIYGAWMFIALSVTVGPATAGKAEISWRATVNANASSGGLSSASTMLAQSRGAIRIGSVSSSATMTSGTRIAALAQWSRALSDVDLAALYAQVKTRFAMLP